MSDEFMLSAVQAAEIIGRARQSVLRYSNRGILDAERRGLNRELHVTPDALRRFARTYNIPFDEELLAQYRAEWEHSKEQ